MQLDLQAKQLIFTPHLLPVPRGKHGVSLRVEPEDEEIRQVVHHESIGILPNHC